MCKWDGGKEKKMNDNSSKNYTHRKRVYYLYTLNMEYECGGRMKKHQNEVFALLMSLVKRLT